MKQHISQISLLTSSKHGPDIHKVLSDISVNLHKECKDLNGYLEKLGDFSERLNAVYTEFYDELCTAIPPNASPEMINRQKLILTVSASYVIMF